MKLSPGNINRQSNTAGESLRLLLISGFILLVAALTFVPAAQAADQDWNTPPYRDLPRPAGIPARCSNLTPCNWPVNPPKRIDCSERVNAVYGTTILYDCSYERCKASGLRQGYFQVMAGHDGFEISTPTGMAYGLVRNAVEKAEWMRAVIQETKNADVECAFVKTGKSLKTNWYWAGYSQDIWEKRIPRISISIGIDFRTTAKPSRITIYDLLEDYFAEKLSLNTTVRRGKWSLKSSLNPQGGLQLAIGRS